MPSELSSMCSAFCGVHCGSVLVKDAEVYTVGNLMLSFLNNAFESE